MFIKYTIGNSAVDLVNNAAALGKLVLRLLPILMLHKRVPRRKSSCSFTVEHLNE